MSDKTRTSDEHVVDSGILLILFFFHAPGTTFADGRFCCYYRHKVKANDKKRFFFLILFLLIRSSLHTLIKTYNFFFTRRYNSRTLRKFCENRECVSDVHFTRVLRHVDTAVAFSRHFSTKCLALLHIRVLCHSSENAYETMHSESNVEEPESRFTVRIARLI